MTVSIVTICRIGEFESEIRALPPAAKHAWRARNNRSRERVTILLTQYAHLRLRGFAAGVQLSLGARRAPHPFGSVRFPTLHRRCNMRSAMFTC